LKTIICCAETGNGRTRIVLWGGCNNAGMNHREYDMRQNRELLNLELKLLEDSMIRANTLEALLRISVTQPRVVNPMHCDAK
jgi:hypothetical protein